MRTKTKLLKIQLKEAHKICLFNVNLRHNDCILKQCEITLLKFVCKNKKKKSNIQFNII